MKKLIFLTFILLSVTACSQKSESTPDPVTPSSETEASRSTSKTEETAETTAENTITFTDEGFSPASLTVEKGTKVTFENASSTAMRPASDDHPTHGNYPATGGCVGSTFDACEELLPGDTWIFPFDEVGTWDYHDHLNPSHTGTIVVE